MDTKMSHVHSIFQQDKFNNDGSASNQPDNNDKICRNKIYTGYAG